MDPEPTPGTPSVSQEHALDGTEVYCNYVHVLDFFFKQDYKVTEMSNEQ